MQLVKSSPPGIPVTNNALTGIRNIVSVAGSFEPYSVGKHGDEFAVGRLASRNVNSIAEVSFHHSPAVGIPCFGYCHTYMPLRARRGGAEFPGDAMARIHIQEKTSRKSLRG